MKRFLPAWLLLVFSTFPVAAIEPFRDGDVVCFIGDSITRGGWYHSFIAQYYAVRFPDLKLTTYNCGKSGDNAVGTLDRLPWDALQHQPTVAVVMLGMNDATIGPSQDRPIANLEKLIIALRQAGCRVIQIGPSIYDQTADLPAKANVGKNDALAEYARRVRETAARRGNDFVDFYEPMQRINVERQRADRSYTLVGADRVHPGEPGHFVMAYEFLKAQGLPRDVSRIVIDAGTGKVVEQTNCKIEAPTIASDQVKFACTEQTLPFVPTKDARPALQLVPFQDELNRETLTVTGLCEGTYELRIDDTVVGEYAHDVLARGIDLAANPLTPQYQQSEKITAANARRHSIESVNLRGVALVHGMLKKAGIDPTDEAASEKYLREFIAARADKQGDFGKTMAERYLGSWHRDEAKNRELISTLVDTIRNDARPVQHRWQLVRKP